MRRTILIVEDNPADRQLLQRALDKAQFDVDFVHVKDGDQAVSYLDRSGQHENTDTSPMPCMVLLDIKLPRRSGFEVLSWIRKDPRPLRRIPVLMLTSSRHSVDVNRAYELGANAFSVKPETSAQLVQLMESIKTFWLKFNDFPIVSTPSAALPEARGTNAPGAHFRPVLLIEDDRTDAMLIMRGFARAGFSGKIEHAVNGPTALKWIDDRIAKGDPDQLPAFVLLDLKLPGMSGFELLDEIRSRPMVRTIPVVVLAGANDSETINKAYERGANSYLVKSANAADVTRLTGFVKEYWMTMNQNSASRFLPMATPD